MKQPWVGPRKPDITPTERLDPLACDRRGTGRLNFDIVAEPHKPGCGQFAQEAGEVTEVMGRCGVRNARLSGGRAHGECADPIPLEDGLGRVQQGRGEIPVMVR